jgi:hypothetical protein
LQEGAGGRRNHLVMGRKPAPIVVHKLSLAEQRVLTSFLAGRLPAGQVHGELQRARSTPAPAAEPVAATQAAPAVAPVPAVAA